jgi:mannosylglycerate hydrolase MGH1-like protein
MGQKKHSSASLVERRDFLKLAALAAGSGLLSGTAHSDVKAPAIASLHPEFPTSDPRWQRTWDAALAVLAGNIHAMPRFEEAVLVEGSVYPGVWQECAPQEGLVYGTLASFVNTQEGAPTPLQIARNNHMIFFSLQREDGELPASAKLSDPVENAGGYGQIQMVVPIAATAWELSQLTDDDELLVTAYTACSHWDAWLRRYRDTRNTGLVEGFCTYDTGHDNSPRWAGIPNRCPDGDARKCPPIATLPRLCPDLSSTVYGARMALGHMATALGKPAEAERWHADAETIRHLILERLYDPKDAAFYDLDAQNNFVRVRSDIISRVFGEHVLNPVKDKAIVEAVWTRQLHNPKAFWAPYPLTSVAMDDPAFVRPIPRNSWGGASQALTALRAPRWMLHYGKGAEMTHIMQQWCEAIMRHGEFRQQMDPLTGDFTQADPSGYSPAALVFLDFARRLSKPTASNAPAQPQQF